MSDENIGAEHSAPPAGAQNTEPGHMIPKARFDEVNNAYKDLKAQVEKLQAEQSAAIEKQMAEQQEFKQLAEKYKGDLEAIRPKAERIDQMQQVLDKLLAAELEQLPDDARTMIETMPGDTQQRLDWLAANKARLARPPAPQMDAGARGDVRAATVKLTQGQEDALARAQRIDPTMTRERYIASLLKFQGGD